MSLRTSFGGRTLASMSTKSVVSGRVWPGAPVYDFGMVAGMAPGAGNVLGKVVIPRPLLIPPDLAGSAVHVDTAPAGDFATLPACRSTGSSRRSGAATSPTPNC
jgi:hypothetical protein